MLTPRGTLALRPNSAIAWAAFDADWYRAKYVDALGALPGAESAALLAYYLDEGCKLRHAPNLFFDEVWYLGRHPEIAAAVAHGDFESGFDHYCRVGHASLSPHWLFEEAPYRTRHADLSDAVLAASGFANGYDHYLKHGAREGRIGHWLFDPAIYHAGLPPDEAAEADAVGDFAHCLARLDTGAAEPRVSQYFDPGFYRARAAIPPWSWAIEHYLRNDAPTRFDPLAAFAEAFYLARYPDVAAAVAAGELRNGYQHFLSDGAREMRAPHPAIDLAYYVEAHPEVRTDLAAGRVGDAFTHYLRIGLPRGWSATPPRDVVVGPAEGRSLFRARARTLLPLWGRTPLDFTLTEPATLSVIMVLHGQFALTMMALASVRANFAGEIELILVDSGSADETRRITSYVRGARLLRFDDNVGFVRACNAGLYSVTAPSVLLLNNDVELAPGAIGAALRRLATDLGIGAVGGKVVRGHATLQEAGSIIWHDGETQGYLRDASPLAPEANFMRAVDYCSAVFLLVRADLLAALDGFDDAFAPAYYEDVDLCVRIAQAGYRVMYDPAIVVHHLEYGSASTRASAEARMATGRATFVARHGAWLATRPASKDTLRARTTDQRRRVLLIEDRLPLRTLGSGFVRSNDIVSVMAELGLHVTVFPLHSNRADLAAVYAAFPDTVEVMHDRDLCGLEALLRERTGYYDTVWIARTHNLQRVLPVLRRLDGPWPRVVLDTEALASLREAARLALDDPPSPFDLPDALRRELAGAEVCDAVVAVSPAEAGAIRELGLPHVHVLGHLRAVTPTEPGWSERAGMLFVGAMHDGGSPNHDALCWFADAVLPKLERELGWQTRLTVVGHVGSEVRLDRFADHPRITLLGEVADLAPLYAAHRVFVAPTRFAAGLSYKVHEAGSYGLPVMATDLLRDQLGWENGVEIVAAPASDPDEFAAALLSLYQSEALWRRVRDGALERLKRENGWREYAEAIRAVLDQAC